MSARRTLPLLAAGLVCATSSPAAAAPRLRGTYVQVDLPAAAPEPMAAAGATAILYINRCAGGCTITPGTDDARTNRSSILGATAHLPAFPYGDASWNALMDCVRGLYAPFDVQITDVDPGNVPHFEHMVGGLPGALGMEPDVGGVAPLTCAPIPNAITYTFAAAWGNDPTAMCHTVGQETAHAYGIDHLLDCRDPMTYLSSCGQRAFQDTDTACGEDSPRACVCGGTKENSFQTILGLFGPSGLRPSINVLEPRPDARVTSEFFVRVDVGDGPAVTKIEVSIDGVWLGELASPPFVFNSPPNLARGSHRIEVRAHSQGLEPTVERIDVTVHQPCAAGCAAGEVCLDEACVAGPGMDGGLGSSCEAHAECASGLCGSSGDERYCAEGCDLDGAGCPAGFECLPAGERGVCWPGADDGALTGGGCEATGGRTGRALSGLAALAAIGALILFGAAPARSRRRRAGAPARRRR